LAKQGLLDAASVRLHEGQVAIRARETGQKDREMLDISLTTVALNIGMQGPGAVAMVVEGPKPVPLCDSVTNHQGHMAKQSAQQHTQ
jgi:hypothetical protein